jgi:hypothetical protein
LHTVRAAAFVLLMIGCGAPPIAPAPLESRVVAPPLQSCALPAPRRTPVTLAFDRWIGTVGDRSWLIALQGDDYVLVTLDDRGAIATTRLPTNRNGGPAFTLAIAGTQLWVALFDDTRETFLVYDLTTAHPIAREVAIAGRTIDGRSELAISASRALFHATRAGAPVFELIDRQRSASLATAPYETIGFEAPWMRCTGDRCFAVDLVHDAAARRRVVTSFRFAPDGTVTREPLVDIDASSYSAIADADRTRVAWTSWERPGALVATLDATGHVLSVDNVLQSAHVDELQLLPTVPPSLAYGDASGWRTIALDTHAPRSISLQLPETEHLAAVHTADGLLAVAYTSEVTIDSAAVASKLFATFVPNEGRAEPAVDLLFGTHRTSWTAVPLVAPGYAAALALEEGYGPAEGELIMLRAPCAQ